MSEQAPINAIQFARDGKRLEGEIAVAAMQRVHDLVAETSGFVHYRIEGSIDAQRKPVLDVAVAARLPLTCQRCLEPMDYTLQRDSRFVVTEDNQDLPDVATEDPDTETLPADALTDIEDIVEQEVVLWIAARTNPSGWGLRWRTKRRA